jgi:hypothetical protein
VDKATGEIYCDWIENGEWKKVKGGCESLTSQPTTNNQQPTSNQSPSYETASTTESSTELTCTPNWQCKEWQPKPEGVCSGEAFTQSCAQWIDLNNCGTNETPTNTQQATGTKDCSTSSTE